MPGKTALRTQNAVTDPVIITEKAAIKIRIPSFPARRKNARRKVKNKIMDARPDLVAGITVATDAGVKKVGFIALTSFPKASRS